MDAIFKYFPSRAGDDSEMRNRRNALMAWFTDLFPVDQFEKEERLLYHVLRDCARFEMPFTETSLQAFMASKGKVLIFKEKIYVSGTEGLDLKDSSKLEFAHRTAVESINLMFRMLTADNLEVNFDDFVADAREFMDKKKKNILFGVASKIFTLQNTPEGKKLGDEDIVDEIEYNISLIKEIYSEDHLDVLSAKVHNVDAKAGEHMGMYGLQAIDEDTGGMYRGQLVGVEGEGGGGKTRFACGQLVYSTAVNGNRDGKRFSVLYLAGEQTVREIEDQLTAKHVFMIGNGKLISDTAVARGHCKEEDITFWLAARYDLFESGKYGKIRIIDDPLVVDRFLNTIKMNDRLHGPFDVVVIDHMYLMEPGKTHYKVQTGECVRYAYQLFKRYVKLYNKLGIALNQLNAIGIEASKADKPIPQTGAAGGIEVYRNTDFNIAIGFTEEMKLQGIRRLQNPKTRSSKGYGIITVKTRLGSCVWYQKAS